MTLQEIKDYALSLGYTFDDASAQDVIDTRPSWATWPETVEEAVNDYLNAYER